MARERWLNGQLNGTGKPSPTWLPQKNRHWPAESAPTPTPAKSQLLAHLKKTGQVKTREDKSVK